jgi:hypothetical protein
MCGYHICMPKKHRYSAKERRQIEHIKQSEKSRGVPAEEAEAIGYATVNKQNPKRHRFTVKERRQVEHIAESEEALGQSAARARRIGFATVNKRRS